MSKVVLCKEHDMQVRFGGTPWIGMLRHWIRLTAAVQGSRLPDTGYDARVKDCAGLVR